MTIYEKVVSVFSALRRSINGKADNSEIAPDFSDSTEYNPGDVVMYNDMLYICESEHHGQWDGRHFTRKPLSEIIPTRASGLINDIGFVDASAINERFGDMQLPDNATQADTRRMVQSIIAAMKSLATATTTLLAAMVSLSSAGAMPGDNTKWEDVDPTNIVKDVVVKFSPPADFSTNNSTLVSTINATADFSTNNVALTNTISSTVDLSASNAKLESAVNAIVDLSTNNAALTNTIINTVDLSTNNVVLTNTINATVDFSTNNEHLVSTVKSTADKFAMWNMVNWGSWNQTYIYVTNRTINYIYEPRGAKVVFPERAAGECREFLLYINFDSSSVLKFPSDQSEYVYFSSDTNWPLQSGTQGVFILKFLEIPPPGVGKHIFMISTFDIGTIYPPEGSGY